MNTTPPPAGPDERLLAGPYNPNDPQEKLMLATAQFQLTGIPSAVKEHDGSLWLFRTAKGYRENVMPWQLPMTGRTG